MKLFEKNEAANAVRIVLVIAGVLAILLNYFVAPFSYYLGVIGVVLLALGIMGLCGLYPPKKKK